jgi:LPXTG-site transpeptidase (sortase) family protein
VSRASRFIGIARPAPGTRSVPQGSEGPSVRGRARIIAAESISRHRRLWSAVVLHRFEVLAWVGVLVVLAVTGLFVVRAVDADRALSGFGVRFMPVAPSDPAPTPCVLDSCARPPLVGSPTRVRIDALAVDSALVDLALDDRGQLAAPTSYDVAGWFAAGVLPGEAGPAVIAGHVDSAAGPGVFYRLHELKTGDAVDVLRGGTWVRFRVTTTEQYAKDRFPSERVYRPTPDAELRLITCGGDFDRGRLSYRDNIVVYAVIE